MPVVALLGHGVARRGREEGGGRTRCGSEEGRSRRRRWRCGAEVLLGEGEGRTRCCSEQMGKKKEV